MTAPTITDHAALACALNDYARMADDEARKARKARDTEIRRLYAEGLSGTRMAQALGMTPRAVYDVINAE